jgi:hypothetical protein
MTIGGKKINFSHFLFDGCHKFYLTNESKITDEMAHKGYTQDDLYPINDLPYLFFNSCPLRFIQTWDNYECIVPQCRGQVTFRNYGKHGYSARMDFARNKVYTDEPLFRAFPSSSVVFQRMN